jgi:hypothetical protein
VACESPVLFRYATFGELSHTPSARLAAQRAVGGTRPAVSARPGCVSGRPPGSPSMHSPDCRGAQFGGSVVVGCSSVRFTTSAVHAGGACSMHRTRVAGVVQSFDAGDRDEISSASTVSVDLRATSDQIANGERQFVLQLTNHMNPLLGLLNERRAARERLNNRTPDRFRPPQRWKSACSPRAHRLPRT